MKNVNSIKRIIKSRRDENCTYETIASELDISIFQVRNLVKEIDSNISSNNYSNLTTMRENKHYEDICAHLIRNDYRCTNYETSHKSDFKKSLTISELYNSYSFKEELYLSRFSESLKRFCELNQYLMKSAIGDDTDSLTISFVGVVNKDEYSLLIGEEILTYYIVAISQQTKYIHCIPCETINGCFHVVNALIRIINQNGVNLSSVTFQYCDIPPNFTKATALSYINHATEHLRSNNIQLQILRKNSKDHTITELKYRFGVNKKYEKFDEYVLSLNPKKASDELFSRKEVYQTLKNLFPLKSEIPIPAEINIIKIKPRKYGYICIQNPIDEGNFFLSVPSEYVNNKLTVEVEFNKSSRMIGVRPVKKFKVLFKQTLIVEYYQQSHQHREAIMNDVFLFEPEHYQFYRDEHYAALNKVQWVLERENYDLGVIIQNIISNKTEYPQHLLPYLNSLSGKIGYQATHEKSSKFIDDIIIFNPETIEDLMKLIL
jgi:hypothetical protein